MTDSRSQVVQGRWKAPRNQVADNCPEGGCAVTVPLHTSRFRAPLTVEIRVAQNITAERLAMRCVVQKSIIQPLFDEAECWQASVLNHISARTRILPPPHPSAFQKQCFQWSCPVLFVSFDTYLLLRTQLLLRHAGLHPSCLGKSPTSS